MNLEEQYQRVCTEKSDINEHCPILRYLGAHHPTIVEFGVRYGTSTIAFLAGRPENLYSYDIACLIDVKGYQEMAFDTNFVFFQTDTLDAVIEETDILFIDTLHTANQLYAEMRKHHNKVLAHIVLHDTVSFGDVGEDGLPGLNYAVTKFLGRHAEWRIDRHFPNNNGLTILSRQGISFPESI